MVLNEIKAIVVDDSALMRKIISDILNLEEDIEVIATAKNGEDLLLKLMNKKPDVITLDVEMPKMDGITTLKEMKVRGYRVPVIMLSSVSNSGTALTMECLENGAFDFISKPSGAISLDIKKVKEELISKVRLAHSRKDQDNRNSGKALEKAPINRVNLNIERRFQKIEAVVIGASTGGPKVLYKIITELPENLEVPIFVVQHMPVGFTKAFADRLNTNSKIKVVEATHGESIEKNVVYIAPGGFHMEIGKDMKIHLNTEPALWGVRPSVDKLFISAAKVYGTRLLSIILTGMGKDGANGTIQVKNSGGITISEDKSTCTIYGMPKAAFETGKVDKVLPLEEMSKEIVASIRKAGR